MCLEMGWTQKQLLAENTEDFVNELIREINKRNRKNKFA